MTKLPCVYMMTNKPYGTIYIGVTSNLAARVWQHKNEITVGFTSRYGLKLLVWFEIHEDMLGAISREKQLKAGRRSRKLQLIESLNPDWNDLYPELL